MLPETILSYLQQQAKQARTTLPDKDASLFTAGVLDSFSLIDFITMLEKECQISVPDSELQPENFDTLAKIEYKIEQFVKQKD